MKLVRVMLFFATKHKADGLRMPIQRGDAPTHFPHHGENAFALLYLCGGIHVQPSLPALNLRWPSPRLIFSHTWHETAGQALCRFGGLPGFYKLSSANST